MAPVLSWHRLARPTIGKKFFIFFAAIALLIAANGFVAATILRGLSGTAVLINVSGSLRWSTQKLLVDLRRALDGEPSARADLDAGERRFGGALELLERGGNVEGTQVQPLPETLVPLAGALRREWDALSSHMHSALSAAARSPVGATEMRELHDHGQRIHDAADQITGELMRHVEGAYEEVRRTLWRLALLDVTLLLAGLLAVRRQIVRPLRHLASVSRQFAAGQYAVRSGLEGADEVGQLGECFDHMAGQLERTIRQVEADIARLKRLEEELRMAKTGLEERVAERTQELAQLNRELEAFSYSVSHDLRAPLRAIHGFAHVLEENYSRSGNEESVDTLGRIKRAAVQLGDVIDALQDLYGLTRQELRAAPVDLSALARSVAADLASAGPKQRAHVDIEEGIQVFGDRRQLRLVLENLLGNALKFSSQRERPHITVGREGEGDGQTIYVADNGTGFDMRFADKLFTPFQRLHRHEEFPGTGIGLATVARIVARHGGRIWAESAVGKGARFLFTLPGRPQG